MPAHVAAQIAARLALWRKHSLDGQRDIDRAAQSAGWWSMTARWSRWARSQAPPIVVYQSRITCHSSTSRGIEPEQRNINPRKYSSTSSFSTRFAKPRHGS
jgi:hypothetical protein